MTWIIYQFGPIWDQLPCRKTQLAALISWIFPVGRDKDVCALQKLAFWSVSTLSSCILLMKSYLCNNHFPGGFSSAFTSKTKTTQSNWPTALKFTLLNMLNTSPHVSFLLLLPCEHVSVCMCIISIPDKQKLSRSLLMRQWQQNCHFCACLCFGVFLIIYKWECIL